MAVVSPSPGSVPSIVPPVAPAVSPLPSTPPQPSTFPPLPSNQPSALTPPPSQSRPVEEPNATTSDPPALSPPPLPNAPPPTDAGTPPPVTSSPPPDVNAPPPSPPASPPAPLPVQQPPPSSPPTVSSPPPPSQTAPPATSPPRAQSPPPSPPNPPANAPPPPPLPTPPTSSPTPPPSSPPPTSSSTPPSSNPPKHSPSPPPPPPPSSEPPVGSSPPASKPPENSPPPPAFDPPRSSPPPPALQAPESSPSPPAAETPTTSPSSTRSPPPSDSQSTPPPSATPVTPTPPSSLSHPPSGSETTVPSSPSLPADNSSFNAPHAVKTGGKGGIGSGGAVAIAVVSGLLILGLIGLVAFWIFKRKKRKSGANGGHIIPASMGSSPRSDGKLLVKTEHPGSLFDGGSGAESPTDHGGFGHSRSWFTHQELLEATGGFSDANLLGEGGFGYVYKGILVDGRVVAVKQLKIGGQQGEREFKAEVEIISRIHHRHLVSLVGYCIWESKRLLVYEYVPNNTLHFHLHGGGPVMDWETRVRIAAGAARGIAYLHEDCHPRIIHRDIKSSNILLDDKFDARVSDFGLAKLALDADTHVSTRVMGTFGYLAPEYATSGKLTEKSDVYSFGVVLLELMTGRKPVDESQPLGDESLVEWARPRLTHALDTGDYEGLIDPQLEKNYIESEVLRMIEAAAACVRHSSTKRPRMGQVVRALDGIADSRDLSNGLRVGESQLYDSAQQSAEIRWFRRMAFGSQDISTDFFSSPAHITGYSAQSRKNINQSADISRQHSQNSQNMGFSRHQDQNINFSAQHGVTGTVSGQLSPLEHQSIQHSHCEHQSTQHSPSVDFSDQGNRNSNIFREGSNGMKR